jgi:esterase/lipase superfamily enzyme
MQRRQRHGHRTAIIAFAMAAVMAGCASRPENVFLVTPTPPVPGATVVDMLVATNRKPADVPGVLFGGERGTPSFADIAVSIPPPAARKVGEIQWPKRMPPNPATEFTTVKADVLDRKAIEAAFHAKVVKSPSHSVLVFVHGFNNRFDDAVFRFAQIVHDSGTDAVPVLFTWPSKGQMLAYGYDRDSATFSRDPLERTLDYLVKDTSVSEVSILAHSMGNWVTLETLRQISIRRGGIPRKIKNVMLASADVDIDIFETQIESMSKDRPKFTIFVAADDRALALSRVIWQSKERLGEINPAVEPYATYMKANRIDVVNLTDIKSDDDINHDKFAQSPIVVRLIGRQLATGQPITDQSIGIGNTIGLAASGVALGTGAALNVVTNGQP